MSNFYKDTFKTYKEFNFKKVTNQTPSHSIKFVFKNNAFYRS